MAASVTVHGPSQKISKQNRLKREILKTGTHKEVFAIVLMIFNQKCYGVSIDNATALIYNYY